ncbi:MAG: D-alanyl-D-alanine carboxypeptidase [Myxococcales bacterium]|nr:D-alanyl-D-alanine carboxypeptidase [Myxococcales bacterium]
MTRGALTRLGLVAVLWALAVGPSPAEAQPRTRGKKPVVTASQHSKSVRAKVRPTAKATATRGKATPPRRPAATPRVTVAGAVRGPSEARIRRAPVAVTAAERTADALDAILRGPLRFGTTGLYVADAATGAELFAIHPDDPLNPASNVKLISTATALAQVGPDFRYSTRLLGAAPDADGVVAGSVYLHGTFDPTLTSGGLSELAEAVAADGVRVIKGDVVVGAQPSRDAIYRARFWVAVRAGTPGRSASVSVGPNSDYLEVVNLATTGKRAKVKKGAGISVRSTVVERDGRPRVQVTITGTIGKGKSLERAVVAKDRNLYTAHLARAALTKAGVAVEGDVHVASLEQFVAEAAPTGHLPIVLGAHRSAPLAEIVARVNKRSINWLADRILTTTTALAHDELPAMDDGVDAMYAWLDRAGRIGRNDAVIDTGSGLSYRTALSPRQIVTVLRAATAAATESAPVPTPSTVTATPTATFDADRARAFRASLSIGGVDGTLRGRFRSPLRGRVHAKTGTLTGVIALSGLLEGRGGRTLVFSLVTNGHSRRQKLGVRAAHEQIVTVLDRYLAELTPVGAEPTAATEPPSPDAAADAADADEADASEADASGDDLGDDRDDASTAP